ncbi:unnamed protein product [Arctogadus glacialis]
MDIKKEDSSILAVQQHKPIAKPTGPSQQQTTQRLRECDQETSYFAMACARIDTCTETHTNMRSRRFCLCPLTHTYLHTCVYIQYMHKHMSTMAQLVPCGWTHGILHAIQS